MSREVRGRRAMPTRRAPSLFDRACARLGATRSQAADGLVAILVPAACYAAVVATAYGVSRGWW